MSEKRYDRLIDDLEEGANHRGYSEGFGGSWTDLCRRAAEAIKALRREQEKPEKN